MESELIFDKNKLIDENDLLTTNVFIPQPELSGEVTSNLNDEFKNFYKNKQEQSSEYGLNNTSSIEEALDSNNILNTNSVKILSDELKNKQLVQRYKKEIKTYVNVDSRDRNTVLYPNTNKFKVFLGRTFYNVKTIKLSSIEFPNVNAVINKSNNNIYWRNLQDIENGIIDTSTRQHPVYNIQLRTGSYNYSSIEDEISNKVSKITRNSDNTEFHYFVSDFNLDTNIVSFTSLELIQLQNNPLLVFFDDNNVQFEVNSDKLDLETNKFYDFYIVGSKSFAGININIINTVHSMKVLSKNSQTNTYTLQFVLSESASENISGGGNSVKLGIPSPFQLLDGEYDNTIAPNLGFPVENSSIRVDTFVNSIKNLNELVIKTSEPHGFSKTFNYLGQTLTINITGDYNNGSSPILADSNIRIMNIIDENTFTVIDPNNSFIRISQDNLTNSYVSVVENGIQRNIDIISIRNNIIDTVIIEFKTNHKYSQQDVSKTLNITNTNSSPDFDGEKQIISVVSEKELIVNGRVLNEIIAGSIEQHRCLTTNIFYIQEIDISSDITIIKCKRQHNLNSGDKVKLYNVKPIPDFKDQNEIGFTIQVIDDYTFSIDYDIKYVSSDDSSYVSSNIIEFTFPNHGFNEIIDLSYDDTRGNAITYDRYDKDINLKIIGYTSTNATNEITITTDQQHNFVTETDSSGSYIRPKWITIYSPDLNNPSEISGIYDITEIVDAKRFKITLSSSIETPTGEIVFNDTSGNTTVYELTGIHQELNSNNEILTVITTSTTHNLNSGDNITIENTDPNIFSGNGTSATFTVDTRINNFTFVFKDTNNVISINQLHDIYIRQPVKIQTRFNHGLQDDKVIRFSNTGTELDLIESNNDTYNVKVIDEDEFLVNYTKTETLILPSDINQISGYIGISQDFFLYINTGIGGLTKQNLNGKKYSIKEIIDKDNIKFESTNFPIKSETGGSGIYVNSLIHGFRGTQSNTKNDILNRSINLEGENYVFLCCPELETMMNTGNVKNIFARISLDQSPGTMVFSYLSNPKTFDLVPLSSLNELEFSVVNYNNTFYEFNDLDYSFVLEITEVVDSSDNFAISSRTGTSYK